MDRKTYSNIKYLIVEVMWKEKSVKMVSKISACCYSWNTCLNRSIARSKLTGNNHTFYLLTIVYFSALFINRIAQRQCIKCHPIQPNKCQGVDMCVKTLFMCFFFDVPSLVFQANFWKWCIGRCFKFPVKAPAVNPRIGKNVFKGYRRRPLI